MHHHRVIFTLAVCACVVACDASKPAPEGAPAAASSAKAEAESDGAAPTKPSDKPAKAAKAAKAKGEAKGEAKDKAKDNAPKAPSNGCPVAIKSVEVKATEDGSKATAQAHNISDVALTNISVAVRYKDASGGVIQANGKDFQTTTLSLECAAKSACELYVPFGPKGAESAEFVVYTTRAWPSGEAMPKTTWKLDWDSASGKWPG